MRNVEYEINVSVVLFSAPQRGRIPRLPHPEKDTSKSPQPPLMPQPHRPPRAVRNTTRLSFPRENMKKALLLVGTFLIIGTVACGPQDTLSDEVPGLLTASESALAG